MEKGIESYDLAFWKSIQKYALTFRFPERERKREKIYKNAYFEKQYVQFENPVS